MPESRKLLWIHPSFWYKLIKFLSYNTAGDLLRAEQNTPESPYGETIASHIKEGTIVPYQITISLLQRAMEQSTYQKFLIDGFPRAMDQAEVFEEQVKGINIKNKLVRLLHVILCCITNAPNKKC